MRGASAWGCSLLNFHPGSHKGEMAEEACMDRIAESVNLALSKTEGVTAVFENSRGLKCRTAWCRHCWERRTRRTTPRRAA